jgi:hypothetical protein
MSAWRLAAVLALALAVLGGVARAGTGTQTKFFDASVTPSSAGFVLTLENDQHTQQTLGSANFPIPAGWTVTAPVSQVIASGWTACLGDGVTCGATPYTTVQLRSASSKDALARGAWVQATVTATPPAAPCGSASAAWPVPLVKQSNDFSGQPGNGFILATSDLVPLGSLAISSIGTPTVPGSLLTYAITGEAQPVTVTARDVCGNVKTDYVGSSVLAGPTTYAASLAAGPNSLDDASFSSLSWTSGIGTGTVTPAVAQVGNTLQVVDTAASISASTPTFDVVDTPCFGGAMCIAHDKKNVTTVTSQVPAGGFIGVGFKLGSGVTFLCGSSGSAIGSIVEIDPSGIVGAYTVSLLFAKSASGSGPASSFNVCLSKDNGASWNAPLQACSSTVHEPCIAARKRASGGALQIDLLLDPVDPWPGVG